MRVIFGFFSILITVGISMWIYTTYLKEAAPAPGMVATQAISLTGVETDLMSLAQAERMYYAQNGSYADLVTLQSAGTMNISRTERDGYTYSADTSGEGFIITARHTAPPPPMPEGVAPPSFPTLSIDQTMQVHQDQ